MADRKLKTGSYIKCNNPNDLADTAVALWSSGYQGKFAYEHDGEKGYFFHITGGEEELCQEQM